LFSGTINGAPLKECGEDGKGTMGEFSLQSLRKIKPYGLRACPRRSSDAQMRTMNQGGAGDE